MARILHVIGGGLAGCEAAWQLAERGIEVYLYEMRPQKSTPAHKTDKLAELVCSNSFRSNSLENGAGLLKEEIRKLNSLIIQCAEKTKVPAGSALAVDRYKFAEAVTQKITYHPNIKIHRKEVTEIPSDHYCIIATGPLTSDKLSQHLKGLTGSKYLYFYDAAAPIITRDSIDFNKVFWGNRYGKNGDDYLNCPMTEAQYKKFYHELINAEVHEKKPFEEKAFFEGCMPIEALAYRGENTLLFGPMKPVGLVDPKTGKQPYAVVQLRKDNQEATLFNMVGFQTSLKWGEQERIFRMIPGLEKAEFVRYGFIHRNTFINSPRIMEPTLQMKNNPGLFFAGQITGVEGYIESASNGLVAGINAARVLRGESPLIFPKETMIGALIHYITTANPDTFQPMKANFGIIPNEEFLKIKDKRERKRAISQKALRVLSEFIQKHKINDKKDIK